MQYVNVNLKIKKKSIGFAMDVLSPTLASILMCTAIYVSKHRQQDLAAGLMKRRDLSSGCHCHLPS